MSENIRQVLDLPPCDQVGFVVADRDAAMALYNPLFGPFTTMEPGLMTFDFRGREEESEIKLAFGKSGDVEIELIEWVSGWTPHREFREAGREGMHHLRFIVESLEDKVMEAEALGYKNIWSKRFGKGLAVSYLEREGDPLVIEFFENHGA